MSAPIQETITWIPVEVELPDDEITVLLAFPDGSIDMGSHCDNAWWISGIDIQTPTHWANMPDGPKLSQPAPDFITKSGVAL